MNTCKHRALLALVAAAAACEGPADTGLLVGELASDRIELTAEANEPLVEILVAEGAPVSAGDVIARQDGERAAARVAEAEAGVGQAQARLDELVRGPRAEQIAAARASLAGAEDELAFRTTELERIRLLQARELAAQDRLDQARAAADAARSTRELRRAQLAELLSGTTVEELRQAEYVLRQAEARRDLARVDLERHTIRAPVDGVLDSRLLELGERPAVGQPMFVVLGGRQPHARVYVPEALRVRLRPGIPVRIHVDGLADPLPGRIRWIASEATFTPYFALTERDRGRLSFESKVDIDGTTDRLPDGVPVQVELLTAGAAD